MYNLADCWEKLGKTASAHAMFLSAEEAARSMGQADRSRMARDRAVALVPKLSRLLVTVGTPADGITVWRDKKQIHQSGWGTATPIDPGMYEIRATAPGKQPWTARVEIPELATTISVTVPPLADEAKSSAPSAFRVRKKPSLNRRASAARTGSAAAARETRASRLLVGNNSRLVALSVGAAGVGALVAGVVLALDYASKNDEASDICPSAVNCSRAEIERHSQLVDDARTSRNWIYLAFGVGGAAVLGAGAIYITSSGSKDSPKSAGVRVSPLVGSRGPVGAFVQGNW